MRNVSRRLFLGASAVSALAADSRADYRIIDPHVHVWKHDPEYPFAAGAKVPDRDATPEQLLALMKANGVARTVLIQVIHYQYDNRYLASVLKRYPAMFQGVARVDPLDPAAPDHLSRLTEEGFRGVRLSPAGDAFRRLVSRPAHAAALEALPPVEGPHDGAGAHRPHARSGPVARSGLPDLTVVIDHMADCPVDQPASSKS